MKKKKVLVCRELFIFKAGKRRRISYILSKKVNKIYYTIFFEVVGESFCKKRKNHFDKIRNLSISDSQQENHSDCRIVFEVS